MKFTDCEGYARGYVVASLAISTDCALVFPSRAEALEWCRAKGLDLHGVSVLSLMDHRAADWL